MIMVLGFEIAANFGDCTIINRQQRLVPFHSMPKPQKSKWGYDIRIMDWNCVMQLPLLLSPPQLFSPPPPLSSSTALLFHRSPLLLRSPPLHSPPQLFSPPPPLSSSALHSSSSLPFFLLQALGLGYPVPICHPNLIKDWLANWHKSVGSMSDQHWSEFDDHCSCIWFGEETSYYTS